MVLSNSMTPEFHSGDVVFVQQTAPSAVQVNDTITYHTPSGAGKTTHKVVGIVEQNNSTLFQTQGIANEEPDPYLVPPKAYIGKVMFAIPLLGVLIAFLQTDMGILTFVLLPLGLLIVSESWGLAVAYFGSRAESDGEKEETPTSATEGDPADQDDGTEPSPAIGGSLGQSDEEERERSGDASSFEEWIIPTEESTVGEQSDGSEDTDGSREVQ